MLEGMGGCVCVFVRQCVSFVCTCLFKNMNVYFVGSGYSRYQRLHDTIYILCKMSEQLCKEFKVGTLKCDSAFTFVHGNVVFYSWVF